jgi:hypothetical protein
MAQLGYETSSATIADTVFYRGTIDETTQTFSGGILVKFRPQPRPSNRREAKRRSGVWLLRLFFICLICRRP